MKLVLSKQVEVSDVLDLVDFLAQAKSLGFAINRDAVPGQTLPAPKVSSGTLPAPSKARATAASTKKKSDKDRALLNRTVPQKGSAAAVVKDPITNVPRIVRYGGVDYVSAKEFLNMANLPYNKNFGGRAGVLCEHIYIYQTMYFPAGVLRDVLSRSVCSVTDGINLKKILPDSKIREHLKNAKLESCA